MTNWGAKIPDESLEELQERLREVDDDGKAVTRLFTAIADKQGSSPAEIEETYGIFRKNLYLWLGRIEEGVSMTRCTTNRDLGDRRNLPGSNAPNSKKCFTNCLKTPGTREFGHGRRDPP